MSAADSIEGERGGLAHPVSVPLAAMTAAGVPVMAHIGFTPQSEHVLGGYRVQGRGDGATERLVASARALEEAGARVLLTRDPELVSGAPDLEGATAHKRRMGAFTATDQGGTVALSAGVVLERSRDNGATWTQISNFTATGQRIFVGFEPELGYNYEFSLTGSTTYTDNTGGTANVNYRLRITSSSGPWPFNFGTGPNPLGRQNLAVISVEQ